MSSLDSFLGQTISHYRIIEKLGGGVDIVYNAQDTRLDRFVALKILPTLSRKTRTPWSASAARPTPPRRSITPTSAPFTTSAKTRAAPSSPWEYLEGQTLKHVSQATSNITIYLCLVYVRGEAYPTLHDGKAAAAEFQKFIDHRGVVTNFPWAALARMQLARAYAMQGDTGKANPPIRTSSPFGKAPTQTSLLKQAKSEHAKLP